MNNHILKNISKNMQDLTFVLCNRNYDKLGTLNNVDINTFTYKHTISGHEISFDIYKTLNNVEENLWNKMIDLKLIWIKELDVYFEIYVSMEDSFSIKKSITGTSLCEAELSQVNLYDIEINTEDDIARDNYKITTFYNSDPKASLLHRILSKVPNYSIKHVDSSLSKIQRSFSIDNRSIYDFLMGECAEQFHCIFYFDSRDRSVSVFDLYAVCQNNKCNYSDEIANFTHLDKQGNFTYTCPKCKSTNIKYFGEDTGIIVDKENLTDSVQFTTDIESVKNCFKLVAGDDIITSTARILNMNGTDYIYCITKEQKEDMPKELVNKIEKYDALFNSRINEYEKIINDIYESSAKIYYYRSSMMPTKTQATVTAKTEAAKLTANNLSPLGLSSVSASTSKATVESALKNYAKVYVRTGYVKLEINNSNYTYSGTDSSGNHFGYWTGNFKVTNYSDENDISFSDMITIKVYDNYESFVNQKIKKTIVSDDEDGSIFDVLSIVNLNSFKSALTYYGLNRLKSFYDAIQSAMDCLVQLNQATTDSKLYSSLYLPYYNKLQACQSEIDKRQATVDSWQKKYDEAVVKQQKIQAELNFENFIGKDLYQLFCCYRREDIYQNDNYISDGLEDQEIIARTKEFLETAQKELVKSATRQHSISSTLYDLLLIPEFGPLLNKFEIGNWLRVRADGVIYKLRLIEYEISFSNVNTISVKFSDVTKINDAITDTKSILQSAKSMSSNYSYISKQADAGHNANNNINHWVENGFNSSLINIKNNDHEEITYGKHGLFAKEYDDVTDSYGNEQLQFTHNILAFTEDNWKTVSLGLGKHKYTYYNGSTFVTSEGYGISAKFCQAAYIYGSQIIGGDLYSENYSSTAGTHINLNNGTFSFAGGSLTYDGKTLSGKGLDISASTITGTNIYASTISSTTINGSRIYGTYINGGTVEGSYIKGGTVEGAKIISIDSSGNSIILENGFIKIETNDDQRQITLSDKSSSCEVGLSGRAVVFKSGNILDRIRLNAQNGTIYLGDSSGNLSNGFRYEQSYGIVFGDNIVPSNQYGNLSLGQSGNKWNDLFVDNINGRDFDNMMSKIDNAATKSSVDSLRSRISSLETAVGQLGGSGSGSFSG